MTPPSDRAKPPIDPAADDIRVTPIVWTCTKFTGHWPVGTAAVVYTHDRDSAAMILNDWLRHAHKLPGDAKPQDMHPFPLHDKNVVRVLADGNY